MSPSSTHKHAQNLVGGLNLLNLGLIKFFAYNIINRKIFTVKILLLSWNKNIFLKKQRIKLIWVL